jgi:hypothetical protein
MNARTSAEPKAARFARKRLIAAAVVLFKRAAGF